MPGRLEGAGGRAGDTGVMLVCGEVDNNIYLVDNEAGDGMEEIWTDTAATFRLAPGAPRPHQQHMPRSNTQPYCTWCPGPLLTRAVNKISRKFSQYEENLHTAK